MIRAFRRYLKKECLDESTMNHIKRLPLQNQGQALGKALDLPDEIVNEPKYRCALVLIFFSYRYTRRRTLIQQLRDLAGRHENELMRKFYFVFNENKNQIRVDFFKDPMVQLLWSKFRNASKDEIEATIKREGCQYFLDHVVEMEEATCFSILPDQSI